MNAQDKITALRGAMKEAGVDGFIIPKADEYQGEFVAPYAERLIWLTGFTGSAGMACVLADKAFVVTDARYGIQIKQQVDQRLYETADVADKTMKSWLGDHSKQGGVIGYDPWLHTPDQIQRLEHDSYELRPLDTNLIDKIWPDRPDAPASDVVQFPEHVAGKSLQEKLKVVQQNLKNHSVRAFCLTLPDSIAWLLNIRAQDVEYIPLALSYAIVYANDDHIDWFIDERRLNAFEHKHIRVYSRDDLEGQLNDIVGDVGFDGAYTPIWFKQALGERAKAISDPCVAPKAIKTDAEQNAIREAHIHDGVALVKFLKWLDDGPEKHELTEWDIAQKLKQFRAQNPLFKASSFPTICGFGEHGAIVHYRATKDKNAPVKGDGLLLIDSGAQYAGQDEAGVAVYGTTDITRTIAIGEVTPEMRRAFTLVLKGHIAVASAKFPAGTTGAQIDTLARHPLWQESMDFAHGTGHGVGCYLAVHEASANLSPKGEKALNPGMLLSNEPGYYKEGAFGIRIENLILCKDTALKSDSGKDVYEFETVSFAPIDLRCLDVDLLTKPERAWLEAYHQAVFDKIGPHLDEEHVQWLKAQISFAQ